MFFQEVTAALSTFLADIGTVLTSATGWVGTVVQVIMETPVLLVPTALSLGLVAIGIFKRLR